MPSLGRGPWSRFGGGGVLGDALDGVGRETGMRISRVPVGWRTALVVDIRVGCRMPDAALLQCKT